MIKDEHHQLSSTNNWRIPTMIDEATTINDNDRTSTMIEEAPTNDRAPTNDWTIIYFKIQTYISKFDEF